MIGYVPRKPTARPTTSETKSVNRPVSRIKRVDSRRFNPRVATDQEYEEYEYDSEGNKKWEDPGVLEWINEQENQKAWDEAMQQAGLDPVFSGVLP